MFHDVSPGLVVGYIGIGLSLLSTFMKSMQPLRAVAIIGNVAGICYGFAESVWPTFVGNLFLLQINTMRLWEIRKLLREMEKARKEQSIAEVLLPHMSPRTVRAGTLLFHRGDIAQEMLYLKSGEIELVEIGKILHPGTLFGEVGLFARDSKRSQSARCLTDCELYGMTRERLYALYYDNPRIGFNLMALVVENLLPQNVAPHGNAAPAAAQPGATPAAAASPPAAGSATPASAASNQPSASPTAASGVPVPPA